MKLMALLPQRRRGLAGLMKINASYNHSLPSSASYRPLPCNNNNNNNNLFNAHVLVNACGPHPNGLRGHGDPLAFSNASVMKSLCGGLRFVSSFDDQGCVLREEERSRENVYMQQRDRELLDKLQKQSQKLEEMKKVIEELKESQGSLEHWVHSQISERM